MDENELFVSFNGTGKLISNKTNSSIDTQINIQVYYNCKIDILIESYNFKAMQMGASERLEEHSFVGTLSDNKKVKISQCYINSVQMNGSFGKPVTFKIKIHLLSDIILWDGAYESYDKLLATNGLIKVGLINFLFGGNCFTSHPNGSTRCDFFNLEIDNKNVNFRQLDKYREIERLLKENRNIMLTSDLEVNGQNINELQDFPDNICWLLSYSQKTLISKFYTKLYHNNKEVLLIFHNSKKYVYSNSTFIEASHLREEHDIDIFLQQTYQSFKNNKVGLKLENIFDIICQAEIAKVLESRYLLLSSALELCVEVIRKENNVNVEEDDDVINNTKNAIANYCSANGLSLDEVHIKNIALKLSYKTLKKKIVAVINYLNFQYSISDINRIKDNRNKIVHQVQFIDYLDPLKDYIIIKLLIDKIIITILGYNGDVINYANNHNIEKIV